MKVMSAIEKLPCRHSAATSTLRTLLHVRISYNSCRDRHCPKCQAVAAKEWLADREADLLPVPYYHVVFPRCRPRSGDIAYQNKAVVYDILFKAAAETAHHHCGRPPASRRPDRLDRRSAHLGLGADPGEPSLMMHGIIISCVFSEQRKLIFRATPLQSGLPVQWR